MMQSECVDCTAGHALADALLDLRWCCAGGLSPGAAWSCWTTEHQNRLQKLPISSVTGHMGKYVSFGTLEILQGPH
jgi:hypothetical protein